MAADVAMLTTALARGGSSPNDITARGGAALPVVAGQILAARVLSAARGEVELAVAGGRVKAATGLPLEAGQTLRLLVASAGPKRVVMRPQGAPQPPGVQAQARTGGTGLPAAAAASLAASLPAGTDPATLARLSDEARAAGVSTPGQAAAFARLAGAGLPTTRAAVAGLAQLIEGAPIGRSLSTLTAALSSQGRAGEGAGGSPPRTPGAPVPAAPVAAPAAPGRAPAPAGSPGAAAAQSAATVAATGRGAADRAGTGGPSIAQPAPAPSVAESPGAAQAGAQPPPQSAARSTHVPAAGGTGAAGLAGPALAELVRRIVAAVTARAVSGDAGQIARAAEELGRGLEARLADDPSTVSTPPLRAALLALAADPDANPALARHASGMADAIGAQALAAALPRAGDEPAPGQGAYLQLPLPGGDSVEVMVNPDAEDGGGAEGGTRRLAFLLHLSALGPVMVEALVGAGGAEAVIRTHRAEAGAFLAGRIAELSEGLREAGLARPARIRVERGAADLPDRLVDPPATSGVDLSA